jgi:hypothetical protein
MRPATRYRKVVYPVIEGVEGGSSCIVSSSQCNGGFVLKCKGLIAILSVLLFG